MPRLNIAYSLALVAGFSVMPALAATFRVDDAASIPNDSSVGMRWRQPVPGVPRQDMTAVDGATAVQVRLNLARWVGRTARLYLVLPEQPTPVSVRWTTQGRLLAGQMASGQRVPVFSGVISGPWLEEVLALKFTADGTRLSSSLRLNFHFEIDVE
jgi:hypothetical protein